MDMPGSAYAGGSVLTKKLALSDVERGKKY